MTNNTLFFILVQFLLLYPSFYVYRFLLRIAKAKNIKVNALICTVLFPIIFTFIFINVDENYIRPCMRSSKFDSQKWKSNEYARYRMVNDLITSRVLIGKTKEEVIALLGNSKEEGPCTNCIGYATHEPEQGFSIDHEVIHISFDNQNKVTSAEKNDW
jgi:hypothetical protein